MIVESLLHLHTVGDDVLAGILAAPGAPNPGDGVAPPGAGNIIKVLQWLKWLVTAAAVAGGLFIAGKMVLAHRRGDDTALSHLGIWLGACVLMGVAPQIVDALA